MFKGNKIQLSFTTPLYFGDCIVTDCQFASSQNFSTIRFTWHVKYLFSHTAYLPCFYNFFCSQIWKEVVSSSML